MEIELAMGVRLSTEQLAQMPENADSWTLMNDWEHRDKLVAIGLSSLSAHVSTFDGASLRFLLALQLNPQDGTFFEEASLASVKASALVLSCWVDPRTGASGLACGMWANRDEEKPMSALIVPAPDGMRANRVLIRIYGSSLPDMRETMLAILSGDLRPDRLWVI